MLAFQKVSGFICPAVRPLVYGYYVEWMVYTYIVGSLHDSQSHFDGKGRVQKESGTLGHTVFWILPERESGLILIWSFRQ